MRYLVAFNRTRGRAIAKEVAVADTAETRAKGLLGRSSMKAEEGLWIIASLPWIHTFFMRFSIDLLFLDKDLRAVRVVENVKPWRLGPLVLSARSVLELPAGRLAGAVDVGDQIEIQ